MGFSKVVVTFFLLGLGMIASGMLMAIMKGSFVNRIIDIFWIDNTPFLNLMSVEYNVMAIIIMIMGIICVFISASEARTERGYN